MFMSSKYGHRAAILENIKISNSAESSLNCVSVKSTLFYRFRVIVQNTGMVMSNKYGHQVAILENIDISNSPYETRTKSSLTMYFNQK